MMKSMILDTTLTIQATMKIQVPVTSPPLFGNPQHNLDVVFLELLLSVITVKHLEIG